MNFNVQVRRAAEFCALFVVLTLASSPGWSDARDQAKRIHDRIAGVPADAETLATMASEISDNNPVGAALIATDAPEFYSVTLKNWAAPWTNRDASVFVPLDDYIATVIGVVRDELDFRKILHDDVLYVGSGQNIPSYSNSSNAHYQALEDQGVDLHSNLRRHQPRHVPLHHSQSPLPRHGAGERRDPIPGSNPSGRFA
jgi:hypothetical protein